MKLLLATTGVAVLVLCMASPAVGQNLVVNDSFEADPCTSTTAGQKLGLVGNAVTGWNIPASDGTYPWCLQNVNIYGAGPTPYGNQWLVLGEVARGIPYTIQQTLTGLNPGGTYMLSFAIASESNCCSIAEVSFPSGSSTAAQTFTAPASVLWKVWATKTMNFTATSSSVTLQFKNLVSAQTGGFDLGLDNVSVTTTGQATGSTPITLVDGNTTCASCQAVQPVGLVPGVGTLTPAAPVFFNGLPVTLGGISYGATAKFGGGNGGFTGWDHVSFTVPAGTPTNNYILQFEVSNAGDTSLATALAIDNIVSPGLTESFEGGVIPPGWTLSGDAAGFSGPTGGTSPAITNLAPTNGKLFAWLTGGCSYTINCNNTLGSVPTSYGSLYQGPGSNGLPALTNGVPPPQALGSPTFGTTLQSPPFALAGGDTLSFDVNFGTNDGTYDFPDFFFVQLLQTLTGTPINATPMQTFIFNNNANNVDEYSFDYSNAINAGTITANGDATPIINNFQITPSDWASRVAGTWAATTQCIAIAGANNNCAQKRQVCTTTASSTPLGSNCAQSSERNILLTSTFDPVTPITDPNTKFGVVEFNDTGSCPFDGLAANFSCPDNGLVFLKGPGQHKGGKGAGITNSNIAIVTGVLPPVTTAAGFVNAAGWTNTNTNPVTGTLTANPPANPHINGSVVAPIDSISYGTSQGALPPTFPPISTDTTVFSPNPPGNASTCPNTITATTPAPPFTIPVNLGHLAEGTWLLHYQARDCAGTNELKFTRDSVSGNWSTNFQSLTINVDNTPPMVTGLTLSTTTPSPGQLVTVSYMCSDKLSGIATCGTGPQTFTVGTLNTPTLNNTFTAAGAGLQSYPVTATDLAGNTSTSKANYTVIPPGDLNGDGSVGCDDLAIVKASFGKKAGQPGYNPIADVNHDGVVNVLDLSFVASRIPNGTKCP
jgi:dockerin type I repeat protein/uncharacterized protein DUF642